MTSKEREMDESELYAHDLQIADGDKEKRRRLGGAYHLSKWRRC